MPLTRKILPTFEGAGQVRFSGRDEAIRYRISGDPAALRGDHTRLRGSFTTTVELAAEAFRAGEGTLVLESGAPYRITMLGHTAGGSEVFVELRV